MTAEQLATIMGEAEGGMTLPDGWRLVPLEVLIKDAQLGFAIGERDPNGVIQLRMNNVTNRGSFDWTSFIRVPISDEVFELYQLRTNDVLFNNTNSVELVGKTALFRGSEEPIVFSNHFTRLRTEDDKLDPAYLSFWLLFQWGNKTFAGICDKWIGQAAVQRKKLLALKIPLPPTIEEQQRIATVLDEQMEAVEQARRPVEEQLEAARLLPRALFFEAFQGITPLTIDPLEEDAPEGWRWETLRNLARLESGHTPSRYHPEWWGGDIPWLALPDIRNLDGKTAFETSEYTNELGIANSSARILPTGTVCLSRTASVGFVTVMGRPMATSQDFVNWVCGEQLDPYFLSFILQASRDYLLSLATGAVHKTIYVPTVKEFRICLPDLTRQKRIAERLTERLQAVDNLKESLFAQLEAIEKMPAALLRKAFAGEV